MVGRGAIGGLGIGEGRGVCALGRWLNRQA